jgi:hypothetical protein
MEIQFVAVTACYWSLLLGGIAGSLMPEPVFYATPRAGIEIKSGLACSIKTGSGWADIMAPRLMVRMSCAYAAHDR